jgi:aldose 1-epimerase
MKKAIQMPVGQSGTEELYAIIFENNNHQKVVIFNYGATIHSWTVSFSQYSKDILLGKDTLDEYMGDHPNFGCVVGRYANRIQKGQFSLNEKNYLLSKNLNGHHLHGGFQGFGKKVWTVEKVKNGDNWSDVMLSYLSKDMEEGYPGNLLVQLNIRFTDENELIFAFEAESDQDTICNLTNHCYFNLGNSDNIIDHDLQILSHEITEVDSELIPTGNIIPVNGTAFDFRESRKIEWSSFPEKNKLNEQNGYDQNFILDPVKNNEHEAIATIKEYDNGLKLEVFTSKPGLQLYTGNWLEGIKGKNNSTYSKNAGLCLEAQYYPDSPNQSHFPSATLTAGKKYTHFIKYKLSQSAFTRS